jgi:hypothetical protein
MRNFILQRTEIHDFHQHGMPPIDHFDDDIILLLRAFALCTVRTLPETFGLGASTILYHLRDSLGSKPYHFL